MSNNNINNSNEARRPKIVEDAPTFNSVAMMPAMAPMMPLRSAAAPPMKHAPMGAQTVEPAFIDTTERKPLKETPWIVSKALTIPSYYQLERSHVFVPNSSPTEVSKRIAECLRIESIAATYDNTQVSGVLLVVVGSREGSV